MAQLALQLSTNKNLASVKNITIRDTGNKEVLEAYFLDQNGQPYNLENKTVTFMENKDGDKFVSDPNVQIVDATGGFIRYTLQSQVYSASGIAWFEINDNSGLVDSTGNFNIRVGNGLGATADNTTYIGAFEKLKQQLETLVAQADGELKSELQKVDCGGKGDKGDTGPQGPKGDKGDTGPQGPKGDKGDSSSIKTIYNIEDYGAKSFDMNFDNGAIINSVISKVGDNGGTILIPAGDFWLTTPIVVNRNYITIQGINNGFRSNIDAEVGYGLSHPGAGSHLLLMPGLENGIIVGERNKSPRISGTTIDRINIQGARERSATVTQTGINIIQDNDGITISNNIIMNLNYGVIGNGCDAISIHNNWICELQNSVHLLNSSQQPSITNNYLGAQPSGITLKLDSAMCATISGNNIYPDGFSNIELNNCVMTNISGNNIQSYYDGIIVINGGNNNLVSSNMIYARSNNGTWVPDPNSRDDKYGIIQISSDSTTITSNHIISEQPVDATRILVRKGNDVRISSNTILGNSSKNKIVCNGIDSNNVIAFNSASNEEFDNGLNTNNRNIWL